MKRRSLPDRRAYSLLRTVSSASPRWRRTWNLSNRMLACGAWRLGGVAERLPHVHHGQANPRALLGPQPLEELVHARLGAILAAEPDRPPPDQIADHDAVGVALPDRDLVDADHLRRRRPRPPQLLPHVLLLELLDRVPVEMQFLGDVLDGRGPAAPADVEGEPLRVEADCPPGRAAAPASPCRTARSRPAGPRAPGRLARPRTRDPAPAALPVVEAPVPAATRRTPFF